MYDALYKVANRHLTDEDWDLLNDTCGPSWPECIADLLVERDIITPEEADRLIEEE